MGRCLEEGVPLHPRPPPLPGEGEGRRGRGRGRSPRGLTISGVHSAHWFRAPRAWRGLPTGTGPGEWRGSPSNRPGAGTSFGEKGPSSGACRGRASGSGFTSMTRSGISISSSVLEAGAGSTRRGVQPALRRDMGRRPGGLAGWRAGGGRAGRARSVRGAQVSDCGDPPRTLTRAGPARSSAPGAGPDGRGRGGPAGAPGCSQTQSKPSPLRFLKGQTLTTPRSHDHAHKQLFLIP